VVALDRSAALLAQRIDQPWAVRADATGLPLAAGCAGVVLCVEAALHFADRRAFFAQAARVLRPGGLLLLADLLVDPARAAWSPLVPAGNAQRTPAEYAACLAGAGLRVRHAADVTEYTWRPYRRALVGAARGERARQATERLLADRPAYAYVEAVAQR
jgi:SAM-dependent methyltransferase